MRKYLFVIAFAALLALAVFSGCGKRPEGLGNFANVDSVELVQDAMSVLATNYPPAKTRIALVQAADDVFGSSLVESMRANGYAVAEYAGPAKGDKYLVLVKKPDGLAFGYVLDGKGDELRVVLHIGDATLSRMYRVEGADDELRYIPQGFWTRKQ